MVKVSFSKANCAAAVQPDPRILFKKKYSHLFNKRGGWNKRGRGAKNAKSLNMEVEINVEGGKIYSHLSDNHGGWNKRGGWDFLEKN